MTRLLPRRRTATCGSCDAELPRSAVWCGQCGAVVAPTTARPEEPLALAEEPDDGRPPPGRPGRRVAVAVAIVAVAAGVAVVTRTPPPGTSLDGMLGISSGASSTAPPGEHLRLAWEATLPDAVMADTGSSLEFDATPRRVGELLHVGGLLVVDPVEGQLVGGSGTAADEGAYIAGDEMIVFDTADGTIVHRFGLPAPDGVWRGAYAAHRMGDVTMVVGDVEVGDGEVGDEAFGDEAFDDTWRRDLVMGVRDGGEVAWVRDDLVIGSIRPPPHDTHVLATSEDDVTPIALDVRTGAVTRVDLPAGVHALTPANEPQALLTAGQLIVAAGGADGPPRLVAVGLASGRVEQEIPLRFGFMPLLIGATTDAIVVARLEPTGLVGLVDRADGTVAYLPRFQRAPLDDAVGDGTRSVRVVGDTVVVADAATSTVTAYDGVERRWQVTVPDLAGIAGADGFVSVLTDVGGTAQGGIGLRLLDVVDGREVFSMVDVGSVGHVQAVVGDVVRILSYPYQHLGIAEHRDVWLDVATGATVDGAAVLEGLAPAPGEERLPFGTELLGMVSGVDGGPPRPVVLQRTREATGTVRVGDGEPLSFDLSAVFPPDDDPYRDYFGIPYLARATDEAIVFELATDVGTSVHGLALATGEVWAAEDRFAAAVAPGIVLTVELPPGDDARMPDGPEAITAVDAATGRDLWSLDPEVADPWLLGDEDLLLASRWASTTAVDTATGVVRWRDEPDRLANVEHVPVMTTRHVVVVGMDGGVRALDRRTGELAWELGPEDGPVTAMVTAGDHVVVGTARGVVLDVDRRGRVVQRIGAPAGPSRAVNDLAVIGHDVLVVSGDRARLYRPRRELGQRADEVELP